MKPAVKERFEKERRERTGRLDLSMMGIETLPELGEMTWLTELNLMFNKISDAHFLEKLTNLTTLNLSDNQISDGRFLEKLTKLTSLKIWRNKISDVGFIEKLTDLNSLDVSRNRINDISPVLPLIKKGIYVDLGAYSNLGVSLYDNPITTPPLEVVQQGNAAILAWFDSFKKEKGQPKHYLREIKVLLLGEGTAGKTSLLKQLKSLPFSDKESQTHGVNVEVLELGKLDRFKGHSDMAEAKARVWDFGGQEIMHASHQFFLSHRSIYVLLLDSRNDAKKEYWLRHIAKFGGGSPCIVAINKIDENPNYDLARNTLNEAFGFIGQRFCRISCKTGEGVDVLAATLAQLIPETELYKTPISADWLNVKNQLEAATAERNYIDRKRFLDICEKNDVTDPVAQQTLLRYLDNLGVVLHFPKLRLRAFYVLDPHWVTIGVYRIINSPSIPDGILTEDKLDHILNVEEQKTEEYDPNKDKQVRYSPDEQLYLVSIMEQFELLYRYDDDKWLVPDLLPKELKNKPDWDESEAVVFIMDYDFLPPNVMSRFIIRMKSDVRDLAKLWRTGVVLESPTYKCSALVTADLDKQRIRISVNGEPHRKREYFSTIRHTLCDIQEGLNLVITEKMPAPGFPNVEVDYEELLGYEKAGRDEYFIGRLGKEFSVSMDFLDKVSTKGERLNKDKHLGLSDLHSDRVTQSPSLPKAVTKPKTIRIFLASSAELMEERGRIEQAVNRKNKDIHEQGIFLFLSMWEDGQCIGESFRSQDNYNKEVEVCDIFLLLYYSKLGKFSKEEFTIAKDRFDADKHPRILIYKKDKDLPKSISTADLISLREFEDYLKEKDHFPITYDNTEGLLRHLDNCIDKLLGDKAFLELDA